MLYISDIYRQSGDMSEDQSSSGAMHCGLGSTSQGESSRIPRPPQCHCQGRRIGSDLEEKPGLCDEVYHASKSQIY